MRSVLLAVLALVIASSGCSTHAPQEIGPDAGNLSINETGFAFSGAGPGVHCGSFSVNASMVASRPGMFTDALRRAGFSFVGLVMDTGNPRHIQLCGQLIRSGILCVPCQEAGDEEGRFVAIGARNAINLNQSLEDMLQEASDQGAVSYVTTPMASDNKSSWKRWDIQGYDGLAVVSPMSHDRGDSEEALSRWHGLLRNGRKKHAYGESTIKDFSSTHELAGMLGSSYQCLILRENLSETSLKSALMKGSFYITNGPEINFTVDGHGPGESLNVTYGSEVELSLEVSSLSNFNRVRIIRNGEVIQEIGKTFLTYNTTLNSTILRDAWFTAEVWGNDYTPRHHDFVHAMTNPVWVSSVLP